MSRRVLVTGGAGFIGSHVADALVARGDEVTVVDDLATGDRANVPAGVPLVVADVSDAAALREGIRGRQFDAVVHAAARTKVVESMEKPELYERVIVDGTRNLLELVREGERRFVNLSTGGAIYGETPRCADESVPVDPPSPYGRLKAEAERLIDAAMPRAITLRLANVYGPRQRTDLEGGVIAIFTAAWKEGRPLTVYGPGTAERDYMYVGDVVAAVISALEGRHRGIYNIGTGIATSVNALIELLTGVLGPPPRVERAPERPGEIQRSCVDASRAARDGLWRPRTALVTGLRLTAAVDGRA